MKEFKPILLSVLICIFCVASGWALDNSATSSFVTCPSCTLTCSSWGVRNDFKYRNAVNYSQSIYKEILISASKGFDPADKDDLDTKSVIEKALHVANKINSQHNWTVIGISIINCEDFWFFNVALKQQSDFHLNRGIDTSIEIVLSIDSQVGHFRETSDRKGLTWGKIHHDDNLGIDFVGCDGFPRLDKADDGPGCDSEYGDTDCIQAHPLLCLKVDDSPRPPYSVTDMEGEMPKEYYQGWARGTLALTSPIKGILLDTRRSADEECAKQLGQGYRVAEYDDGRYVEGMSSEQFHNRDGLWPPAENLLRGDRNFWAYGNIADESRFWVDIADDRATCWDRN